MSSRVLGFTDLNDAAGAMPRLRPGDVAEFQSILLAASRESALVEEFDEDWFWNPRCCEALRETVPEGNIREDGSELEDGFVRLRSLIEEELA